MMSLPLDAKTSARWPLPAGIAAPLVYAGVVLLGGALTPGYSHRDDPISALMETGAPARALIDPLFAVYDLLLVAFALGLRRGFARTGVDLPATVPVSLALVGVAGLLTWPLPMDPVGGAASPTGIAHIALAGAQSLGTLVAILSAGMALNKTRAWPWLSLYCFATASLLLATGMVAGAAAATNGPLAGLWERLTIGAFQQWLVVIAVVGLLSRPDSGNAAPRAL